MLRIERLMEEAERRGHREYRARWILGTIRPNAEPLIGWNDDARAAFRDGQAYVKEGAGDAE